MKQTPETDRKQTRFSQHHLSPWIKPYLKTSLRFFFCYMQPHLFSLFFFFKRIWIPTAAMSNRRIFGKWFNPRHVFEITPAG